MSLVPNLAAFVLMATLLLAPMAASAREVRRGGNGLRSGLIAGAIAWPAFGVTNLLVEVLRNPHVVWDRDNLVWFAIVFPASAVGGAVIGLLEATTYAFVRMLARLPGVLRRRTERSARSNRYGSDAIDARDEETAKTGGHRPVGRQG